MNALYLAFAALIIVIMIVLYVDPWGPHEQAMPETEPISMVETT